MIQRGLFRMFAPMGGAAISRSVVTLKWTWTIGLSVFVVLGGNAWGVGGGFTGLGVPAFAPMLGDYRNTGAMTADNRTDIPKLLAGLQAIHAKDYLHLAWTEDITPSGWAEFQTMAPLFQQAGIRLWLYLTPPSEVASEPFGNDYITWATQCATLAKQYPIVAGIGIDDFSSDTSFFTPSYCKQMMNAAHAIDPSLALLATCYYHQRNNVARHVRQGAIDGVIFPYYYPQSSTVCFSDTSHLLPQIQGWRTLLDTQTARGGLAEKMPLVVCAYATPLSGYGDQPTPDYVHTCLDIGLAATTDGLANGVLTSCLPFDQSAFVDVVAHAYATPEPSTVLMLGTGVVALASASVRRRFRF